MNKFIMEHVNITVTDPQATAHMLGDLFGWKIRWRGPAANSGITYHVGTDDFYLALYASPEPGDTAPDHFEMVGGLNHIGIVVDDLGAMEKRVLAAGLKTHSHQDYEPGRRFYFHDRDHIEYEVVSYA